MLVNCKKYFLYLCLAASFSSCTVYMPQSVPIPLMSHKNELHLSAGFSAPPGVMASACYSPVSHVAVQVYGFTAVRHVQYSQAALGFYSILKPDIRYELFGGLGFGSGNAPKYGGGDKTVGGISGNYSLLFLQANAGRTSKGRIPIEYGIGMKAGTFNSRFLNTLEMQPTEEFQLRALLLEPSAFIRTGRFLKAGLQFNYCYIGNFSGLQHEFPHLSTIVAFTLGYHFHGRKSLSKH